MTLAWIFNLSLIVITIGAQLISRPFLVCLRWLTIAGVSGLIAILSYYTALQYFIWNNNEVARLLLPPYQGIGYFLFYSFTEFWANYLIAAAVGAIGYFLIRFYNKKHGNVLFYPEEPLLCFLAFLLVGHPFWMLSSILLLLALLIGSLITNFISKTHNRVSFYYLWLPIAALTLVLSPVLNHLNFVIYLQF